MYYTLCIIVYYAYNIWCIIYISLQATQQEHRSADVSSTHPLVSFEMQGNKHPAV